MTRNRPLSSVNFTLRTFHLHTVPCRVPEEQLWRERHPAPAPGVRQAAARCVCDSPRPLSTRRCARLSSGHVSGKSRGRVLPSSLFGISLSRRSVYRPPVNFPIPAARCSAFLAQITVAEMKASSPQRIRVGHLGGGREGDGIAGAKGLVAGVRRGRGAMEVGVGEAADCGL